MRVTHRTIFLRGENCLTTTELFMLVGESKKKIVRSYVDTRNEGDKESRSPSSAHVYEKRLSSFEGYVCALDLRGGNRH